VSQKGWLRSRQGRGHDPAQFSFKTGDALYGALECRSVDNLIALSSSGRVYTVPVAGLPSARGDGQPVTAMVDMEPGARIVHMIAGADAGRYILGTSAGYGFAARLGDMVSRQRAGKQFVTLSKGDTLLRPVAIGPDDQYLALYSKKGKLLLIELAEVKQLSGGGRGTILMGLDAADALAQWLAVGPRGLGTQGVYRGRQTLVVLGLDELADYIGKRARKGRLLAVKIKQPVLAPPDAPSAGEPQA
jgi:topoisomerase-4 subunit A